MNELSDASEAPRYQTYLLTCWQERDQTTGAALWRFRLETARTGNRRIFTALEEVMSIIETEIYPIR